MSRATLLLDLELQYLAARKAKNAARRRMAAIRAEMDELIEALDAARRAPAVRKGGRR